MNLKFVSIRAGKNVTEKLHRASGPTSICPSPSMDLKKDGLPQEVRPVLPLGRTDMTVRNTGTYCGTVLISDIVYHQTSELEQFLTEFVYGNGAKLRFNKEYYHALGTRHLTVYLCLSRGLP